MEDAERNVRDALDAYEHALRSLCAQVDAVRALEWPEVTRALTREGSDATTAWANGLRADADTAHQLTHRIRELLDRLGEYGDSDATYVEDQQER